MQILWVGQEPAGAGAGDEVFDRRTVAALRAQGHTVTLLHPRRVSRLQEAANLLAGTPYYRARFASARNLAACASASSKTDVTICSWEPLDVLVPVLPSPVILVLHNVTSRALPAMFPDSRLSRLAAARAGSWERALYRRGRVAAIATLSRPDRDYVAGLEDGPEPLLTIPGMPRAVRLAPGSGLRRELVLSGTFGWHPKRRDVIRFAEEYAPLPDRLPVFASGLPAAAAKLLKPSEPPNDESCAQAIRFGLIADRFEAGHKLKTLAYVANNQVVLTYADVSADFAEIPDYELFIRKLATTADIAQQAAAVAALPAEELRARFLTFQQRCAETFSWEEVAQRLVAAADRAIGRRNERDHEI